MQVLNCQLTNIKLLINNLSAINWTKDQFAKCSISEGGIMFSVEGSSKSFEAHAFIDSKFFTEYNFRGRQIELRINLSILLDCINIFGKSSYGISTGTKSEITYPDNQGRFSIKLEENDVVTQCSIAIIKIDEDEFYSQLSFDTSNNSVYLAMPSEVLKEIFNELDWSCSHVKITFSNRPGFISFQTEGTDGTCHIRCSKDPKIFSFFQISQTQSNKYLLNSLKACAKALNYSSKVSIRTNENGMLLFQHVLLSDSRQESFVEFLLCPSVDEDSDDESENNLQNLSTNGRFI
ncbi:cell cycle checkpoint protein rad1 [Anaeramoeba ignava]|uniref:Cell cycle checkpoint protein rad1 n=1 Tax=Anaeramoeba ignava TaxID=1746090 RepID=A0A9Q0LVB1_ANAIG|nr:cell cycle checkpoint protein rad1 [Anaeramoeba ignava]